jgi:hypothetical protein
MVNRRKGIRPVTFGTGVGHYLPSGVLGVTNAAFCGVMSADIPEASKAQREEALAGFLGPGLR